jgi:hypothetical protein
VAEGGDCRKRAYGFEQFGRALSPQIAQDDGSRTNADAGDAAAGLI